MPVKLARDGNLCCKVHGYAALVMGKRFGKVVKIVHPLVFGQHTQVGCHIMTAVNRRHFREFVALISLPGLQNRGVILTSRCRFGIAIKQVNRGVLEHSGMLTLYHALHERACRRVGTVVFAFITHPSGAFNLPVHAVQTWLLRPYFKLWGVYFHAF